MAFKTEIVWHKASEGLPERSGDYLVYENYDGAAYRGCVGYSAIHKKFNAHDDDPDGAQYAFEVEYWAEFPSVWVESDG